MAGVSADDPWSEEGKPQTSVMPSAETLAEWGVKGYDVAVGGDHVKDGKVIFRQLGEVPMATFMLDNPARAALQSRLPGYAESTQPPEKPHEPYIAPFKEPAPPSFGDLSDQTLRERALAGATHGEDSTNFTGVTKADGSYVTKVEKYVRKWKKGELKMPSAANGISGHRRSF